MTKERKAAEEKLEEAIKEFMAFKGHDDGILMDWAIVVASHLQDDEGPVTANAVYVPSHQPQYRTLGLMAYGHLKAQAAMGGPQ